MHLWSAQVFHSLVIIVGTRISSLATPMFYKATRMKGDDERQKPESQDQDLEMSRTDPLSILKIVLGEIRIAPNRFGLISS